MLFTFVLFLAPQTIFTFLFPLQLGKTLGGLALVTYLLDRLRSGHPLTVWGTEVKLVLAFFAVAMLSIPFSRWPGGSVELLVGQLMKSVIIFFLLANTLTTWRRVRIMILALTCFGVVMAVQALLNFMSGHLIGVDRIAGYDAPLAANPNDLALTLNLILGLLIGLVLSARSVVSRSIYLGAGAILTVGSILTFSRAGFLGLVTLFGVAANRFVTQKALAAVVALGVIGIVMSVSPEGYVERMYSIWETSADPTGSAQGRLQGMTEAVALAIENPLFGVGLGMDQVAFADRGLWWTEVHSAYLQVAAEIGLVGFLIYVSLIWHLITGGRDAIRKLSDAARDRRAVAYAHGVQIALYTFAVQAFFYPIPYHFYLFYPAGICVALQRLASRPAPARSAPERRTVRLGL